MLARWRPIRRNSLPHADGCSYADRIAFIDLRRNRIGSPGAGELGDMLLANKTLKKMDLGWNQVRGPGAAKMLSALSSNKTLLKLKVTLYTLAHMTECS